MSSSNHSQDFCKKLQKHFFRLIIFQLYVALKPSLSTKSVQRKKLLKHRKNMVNVKIAKFKFASQRHFKTFEIRDS